MDIGSTCYETSAHIRDLIKDDDPRVQREPLPGGPYACQLCFERITGEKWSITLDDGTALRTFYIHDACRDKAKTYQPSGSPPTPITS
jgi:hypothetical protein